jgi:uncharacterized protein YbbK (DUF523 family)
MEKLLISSCLLGELVKYNGSHNILEKNIIEKLEKNYEIYSFCPEVSGGLPIPRIPCEIKSFYPISVINKVGENKTKEFLKGANDCLEFCKEKKIFKALLKANSPSCSNDFVYDGSFNSIKVKAKGITANLLEENQIKVFNENQIDKLLSI